MKSTGVIRRIDELGRIVIPKEIRKNLRIKEGENLEIFIENDELIYLKKYSVLNKFKELANNITNNLNKVLKKSIIVTDMNNIISYDGTIEEIKNNQILDESFFELLNSRKNIYSYTPTVIKITEKEIKKAHIIIPLIHNGDLLGSLVILENKIDPKDEILADLCSKILISYIE